ncbi:MAG TPA: hypothetical protein VHE55_13945 [Fimbriimonadaceae bacterium]|nr:hypothetical protein [Fimbriimonadaceae bacterium]
MRRIFLIGLAAASVGCYKQRSIVGEWSTRADVGSGTLIFREDCTFRAVREAPLASLLLDGTYEYKGETLRLHVVKWGVPRGPKLSPHDQEEMNRSLQTDSISTVRWTDDNHIQISGGDGNLTTAERVSK